MHSGATQNHKSNRESLKHEWDKIFLCLPNISISCGGLLELLSQRKTPNILLVIYFFLFSLNDVSDICPAGWTTLLCLQECVIMSYNYSLALTSPSTPTTPRPRGNRIGSLIPAPGDGWGGERGEQGEQREQMGDVGRPYGGREFRTKMFLWCL